MIFVIIGVAMIVMNLLGFGPMAAWNWEFFGDLWKFIAPFILAVLWWTWSDKSGLNTRREMARMDAKKEKRRRDNLASMGMDTRVGRKSDKR